jgi:hypothetical protein
LGTFWGDNFGRDNLLFDAFRDGLPLHVHLRLHQLDLHLQDVLFHGGDARLVHAGSSPQKGLSTEGLLDNLLRLRRRGGTETAANVERHMPKEAAKMPFALVRDSSSNTEKKSSKNIKTSTTINKMLSEILQQSEGMPHKNALKRPLQA